MYVTQAAENDDVEPLCEAHEWRRAGKDPAGAPEDWCVYSHTQSTERTVKLTTEVAAAEAGSTRQDG